MWKKWACLFLLAGNLHASVESNRILYLMQTGQVNTAFDIYQKHAEQQGHHDRELLQQIGLTLLDQGFRSSSEEAQIMTLFGAGIAIDDKVLYILENGIKSPIPQVQLISLANLGKYRDDRSEDSLRGALTSNYLIIRLEALHQLALRKSRLAIPQAEALMCKVEKEAHPVFPQIFAIIGTTEAMKVMQRFMTSIDEKVRVAAILSVGQHGCDSLLPTIRMLASQHGMMQLEACAFTLGAMKDELSSARLEILSRSEQPFVRLTALHALYQLGRLETKTAIEEIALKNDLFAIQLLADMPGSEETLAKLVKSDNVHIRINAGVALLQRRDVRCLPVVTEILIKDPRDLAFNLSESPGHALKAWRVIPSASHNLEDEAKAISVFLREDVLRKSLELPENEFLKIAMTIFMQKQYDLVPVTVELLEKIQSPDVIELLKHFQQKAGVPLIRNYCTLSLFRLNEPGPYAAQLRNWVSQQSDNELIRFRPVVSWFQSETKTSTFQLTPEETSQLLIQTFEAFTQKQEDEGLDVLLEAIRKGNEINKYALAGLLIRASQ